MKKELEEALGRALSMKEFLDKLEAFKKPDGDPVGISDLYEIVK